VLRDVIPLVVVIVGNVLLGVKLVNYLKKNNVGQMANTVTIQYCVNNKMVNMVRSRPAEDQLAGIYGAEESLDEVQARQRTTEVAWSTRRSQIRATCMVMIICSVSLLRSSIVIVSIIYSSNQASVVSNLLGKIKYFI
jgi:hypothetical protein